MVFREGVINVNVNLNNSFTRVVLNTIQHYNHEKYWRYRNEVINLNSKLPKLVRLYYLFVIKRMDAFNGASFGTDLGGGAQFETPPILFHGINGIIVSHYAKIGKDCVIFQRVTLAEGKENAAPTIGDNCLIGSNAVIIGGVRIGNNVQIGANAVVTKDIPDNCTVAGVPAEVVKIS